MHRSLVECGKAYVPWRNVWDNKPTLAVPLFRVKIIASLPTRIEPGEETRVRVAVRGRRRKAQERGTYSPVLAVARAFSFVHSFLSLHTLMFNTYSSLLRTPLILFSPFTQHIPLLNPFPYLPICPSGLVQWPKESILCNANTSIPSPDREEWVSECADERVQVAMCAHVPQSTSVFWDESAHWGNATIPLSVKLIILGLFAGWASIFIRVAFASTELSNATKKVTECAFRNSDECRT